MPAAGASWTLQYGLWLAAAFLLHWSYWCVPLPALAPGARASCGWRAHVLRRHALPLKTQARMPCPSPCTSYLTHDTCRSQDVLQFPAVQRHRYFRLKQRLPAAAAAAAKLAAAAFACAAATAAARARALGPAAVAAWPPTLAGSAAALLAGTACAFCWLAAAAALEVVFSERLRPDDYADREPLAAQAACLSGKRGELMAALALHDVRWGAGWRRRGQAGGAELWRSLRSCRGSLWRRLGSAVWRDRVPCACPAVAHPLRSRLAGDVGKAAARRADMFADETGERWKPVAGAARPDLGQRAAAVLYNLLGEEPTPPRPLIPPACTAACIGELDALSAAVAAALPQQKPAAAAPGAGGAASGAAASQHRWNVLPSGLGTKSAGLGAARPQMEAVLEVRRGYARAALAARALAGFAAASLAEDRFGVLQLTQVRGCGCMHVGGERTRCGCLPAPPRLTPLPCALATPGVGVAMRPACRPTLACAAGPGGGAAVPAEQPGRHAAAAALRRRAGAPPRQPGALARRRRRRALRRQALGHRRGGRASFRAACWCIS